MRSVSQSIIDGFSAAENPTAHEHQLDIPSLNADRAEKSIFAEQLALDFNRIMQGFYANGTSLFDYLCKLSKTDLVNLFIAATNNPEFTSALDGLLENETLKETFRQWDNTSLEERGRLLVHALEHDALSKLCQKNPRQLAEIFSDENCLQLKKELIKQLVSALFKKLNENNESILNLDPEDQQELEAWDTLSTDQKQLLLRRFSSEHYASRYNPTNNFQTYLATLHLTTRWMETCLGSEYHEEIKRIQKYHNQTIMGTAVHTIMRAFFPTLNQSIIGAAHPPGFLNRTVQLFNKDGKIFYRIIGEAILKNTKPPISLGNSVCTYEVTENGLKLVDLQYDNALFRDLINTHTGNENINKEYAFLEDAIKKHSEKYNTFEKYKAFIIQAKGDTVNQSLSDDVLRDNYKAHRQENIDFLNNASREFGCALNLSGLDLSGLDVSTLNLQGAKLDIPIKNRQGDVTINTTHEAVYQTLKRNYVEIGGKSLPFVNYFDAKEHLHTDNDENLNKAYKTTCMQLFEQQNGTAKKSKEPPTHIIDILIRRKDDAVVTLDIKSEKLYAEFKKHYLERTKKDSFARFRGNLIDRIESLCDNTGKPLTAAEKLTFVHKHIAQKPGGRAKKALDTCYDEHTTVLFENKSTKEARAMYAIIKPTFSRCASPEKSSNEMTHLKKSFLTYCEQHHDQLKQLQQKYLAEKNPKEKENLQKEINTILRRHFAIANNSASLFSSKEKSEVGANKTQQLTPKRVAQ